MQNKDQEKRNGNKLIKRIMALMGGGILLTGCPNGNPVNPTPFTGTIDSLTAVQSSYDPGEELRYVLGLTYNKAGTETVTVDPDGNGPIAPIEKVLNIPGEGSYIEEIVTENPNPGFNGEDYKTLTSVASLESSGDSKTTSIRVDNPEGVPVYEPVDITGLDNSGVLPGDLNVSIYNPESLNTSIHLFGSNYDSDLETLISNGDADDLGTIDVSGGEGTYEAVVSAGNSNATKFIYAVPDNQYDLVEKDSGVTAGMPEIGYAALVQFDSDMTGHELTVRTKEYDNLGVLRDPSEDSTKLDSITIDGDYALIRMREYAEGENMVFDIYVDGVNTGSSFTYTNGHEIMDVNLP
ncbi:MAG: hypothetical protein ACLFPQ_06775 [Candidatus Woesearchaeota archaeon]